MKVGYNKEQDLVVYSCGESTSCFGLNSATAFEILPKLDCQEKGEYPITMHEISSELFSKLHSAHKEQYFKNVSGYQVSKCAKPKHVKLLAQAAKNSLPVMVEYDEGHEMFSDNGIHSSDGKTHTCWIGESTGDNKIFLHLERDDSDGGAAFSFHGLKSVSLINTRSY